MTVTPEMREADARTLALADDREINDSWWMPANRAYEYWIAEAAKTPGITAGAAAIWEATSSHPRVRGMSWPELLEACQGNPGAWDEHFKRCVRQAKAAYLSMAALDPEVAELRRALAVESGEPKEKTTAALHYVGLARELRKATNFLLSQGYTRGEDGTWGKQI